METLKKYRYVMLQSPEVDEQTGNRQIELVKMNCSSSNASVDSMVRAGYTCVGFIDSDLSRNELHRGLTVHEQHRLDALQAKIYKIGELVKSLYD